MINDELIVMPIHYLPSINWYKKTASKKTIQFSIEEIYRKENHPNRCIIFSANGPLQLNVPLLGGRNQKGKICNLKIAGNDWKRNHLNAIRSAYGKATFFIYYFDALEQIILKSSDQFTDLCKSIIKWLTDELLTEIRIETHETNEQPIIIYSNVIKKYHQVFDHKFGFQSNMSAIDLLFSAGPEARNFLQ